MENAKYTPAESNILGIDIILFEDNEAACGFRTAIPFSVAQATIEKRARYSPNIHASTAQGQ